MFLSNAVFRLRTISILRPQIVSNCLNRLLSHNVKLQIDSDLKNVLHERNATKSVEEATDAAKENKEQAEWDKLSFFEKLVKKYLPSQINSIGIFVVLGVGYVLYEQAKNDYEIKHTFSTGSCPNFKFTENHLLERESLLNTLTAMMTPVADKLVSSYYIITGEHGTGKTTLVRQAARKIGRGVIYVDIPSNVEKTGFAFARAIRYNFKEHIRLSSWIESKMFGSPPDDGKEASWERVFLTFQSYAIDFKKRYGCVPVLIFDNCDLLASNNPKLLEILQDAAKTAIDDSTWVTVFVTSVGATPEQMEGRSSITRAASFFEIPDLTEKEAFTYLIQKRNLPEDMAKQLYNLFGGRLKSLQNAATKIESGVPFATIRRTTLQDIARRIEKIRCRANDRENAFIFNVLCGLLHRPELTVDELIQMESDPEVRQKMLKELRRETILMHTVEGSSFTFHCQSTRVCVEEFYKEEKCFHCKSIEHMKF